MQKETEQNSATTIEETLRKFSTQMEHMKNLLTMITIFQQSIEIEMEMNICLYMMIEVILSQLFILMDQEPDLFITIKVFQ